MPSSLMLAAGPSLMPPIQCVFLAWLIVFGIAGTWVGDQRGRMGNGFVLGLLFGPLGLILAALLPPSQKWQQEREQACELARCKVRAEYERKHGGGVKASQNGDDAEFARWRASQL